MSKKKRNKETDLKVVETEVTVNEENKEETEMTTEKVGFVRKIGRGIKGFFTSKAGKTVAIIGTVAVGVTAAGVTIYKVFFADGSEELIEADTMEEETTFDDELDLDDETSNEGTVTE